MPLQCVLILVIICLKLFKKISKISTVYKLFNDYDSNCNRLQQVNCYKCISLRKKEVDLRILQ